MKYEFGDLLYYISPKTGMRILCVFIRGTNDAAYVMFKIANRITKVEYENLRKVQSAHIDFAKEQ